MLIQKSTSGINSSYEDLGELLKARSSELSDLMKKIQAVHEQSDSLLKWIEDTKKTAASSRNPPSDSVKTQIEQQKVHLFDELKCSHLLLFVIIKLYIRLHLIEGAQLSTFCYVNNEE